VYAALDGARVGNFHGAVAKAKWIVSRMEVIIVNDLLRKQHRKTLELWRLHEHGIKRFARGKLLAMPTLPP
jgi:hypothetical protein